MTGIRSSDSNYHGWDDFGQWGVCGASSPYWYSAAPLSDVVIYDIGFTGNEVTVHGTEANFQTWFADGDGGWIPGHTDTFTQEDWELATGEFNGDTLTDIVTFNPTPGTGWRVRTANDTGDGDFTLAGSGNFGNPTTHAVTGYFTNDRYTDLYRYDDGGTFWTLQAGDGTGDWDFLGNGNWGNAVTQTLVGYFDDDKRHDLLRYKRSTGSWSTKGSDGSGGWNHNSGSFHDEREIFVGHLDQDERTDVLVHNATTGGVGVRLGTGSATFTTNQCDDLVGYGCTWPTFGFSRTIVFPYLDRDAHAD